MNRLIRAFALVCIVCSSLSAQQSAPKTQTAKPMDPLAWLVGGVWTADASKLGPNMIRIETRYAWSDNNAFVRFTTHFVMKEGTLKNYDGQFFWNPGSSALQMWYMDARNELTEGKITVEDDTFRFDFHDTNFAGKLVDLRVLVTRKTNDLYIWQLEQKATDGWKQLGRLEYVRTA
jgi:hypothetical protein